MSDPYIGEIRMFGFNFAPRGWTFCEGQLLAISQFSALFSLLGTTYGGNGESTFGLPDLQGRCPLGQGNGPGLTNRPLGQKSGSETHTLTTNNLPAHSHGIPVTSEVGNQKSPVNGIPATANDGESNYQSGGMSVSGQQTSNTGASASVNHMPPYLAVNFSIALFGIFPSRS